MKTNRIGGKVQTVSAYINSFPANTRVHLKEMRATIRKYAPHAREVISYGIPTYKLNGNLVHFGAYPTHLSLYPGSEAIRVFRKQLSKYECSKGTIRFPLDTRLPRTLIARIVAYRVMKATN